MPDTFRGKKKVGQIYINIPGGGSFSVTANQKDPGNLNVALKAAADAFWAEYVRSSSSNDPSKPAGSEG